MQKQTPEIQLYRTVEVTEGPNYHAAVSINGRRRWYHVNSGTFDNDALAVHGDAVLDQLRDHKDLLFLEYGEDGSRRYTGLKYHDPEVWAELLQRT